MKECYETLKHILEVIKYKDNKWKICCDLKVVNILQGILATTGFPKYFCYKCNWDTRTHENQYKYKGWQPRTPENKDDLNLVDEPLIENIEDILLPSLHMKLGITSKFIEMAVQNNKGVFDCLEEIFPKLSDAKIEKGK